MMSQITIWKYPLRVYTETRESIPISMPAGAEILCVQAQGQEASIWALVDRQAELVPRVFRVYKTNRPIDQNVRYIGTVVVMGQAPVFHVFEEL